jgi:hypothetical protein
LLVRAKEAITITALLGEVHRLVHQHIPLEVLEQPIKAAAEEVLQLVAVHTENVGTAALEDQASWLFLIGSHKKY